MRKNSRSLAGFADVASEPRPSKKDNDINDNANVNVNININNIIGEDEKKELVGIYFKPHLVRILDQLAGKKRGAKSAIVNEALERLFKEMGQL